MSQNELNDIEKKRREGKELSDSILREKGVPVGLKQNVYTSLDEINSFGDKASIEAMVEKIVSYNRMLKERISFITPGLTNFVPFTRENFYLLCAYSGNGKSTIAANISYSLWQEGKKTLILSNEESKNDICMRLACLKLGYNFNDYKKGKMSTNMQAECVLLFPEITKCVKIIDVDQGDKVNTIEGIKMALTSIENRDFSCALIDYYQLIRRSIDNPKATTYEVLNDLRVWIGQYIKRTNVPIVMFAQLHSLGKRKNKDLDSRIKDCPAIYEQATVVLEAVPDFENSTTHLLIHKDRFGCAGKSMSLAFDKGRYVDIDQSSLQKITDSQIKALENKAEGQK